MKIALLCNHPLAFPAIEALFAQNALVGLATPQIMHETTFKVQVLAQTHNIPFAMINPTDKERSLENWLKKCKPDIVFVITFPYRIPEKILRIPKYGFFNWHTGLLPSYRGADPIFWQILNQEEFGGITVHKMNAEYDEGPIVNITKEEIPFNSEDPIEAKIMQGIETVGGAVALRINGEDTYGQHIQKLAIATKKATDYMLKICLDDPRKLRLFEQDEKKAAYQKKPDFTDLMVYWEKDSSSKIKALTRASNPVYGGAISFFRGVPVHLLQVSIGSMPNPPAVKAGTIVTAGAKEGIVVLCSDQKLLRLDVVYTEDGFFTGGKLASIFEIKANEEFLPPPEMPFNPEDMPQ